MDNQQYCPLCFQQMTQDMDNPWIWWCDNSHYTEEKHVYIDLTPKNNLCL